MPKFYSQNGEDALLWWIFGSQPVGSFVDVGAHDGIVLSNTLALEQNGWRGVCIEPNEAIFLDLVVNRPQAICIQAACGAEYHDSAMFWATPDGYCSTLDNEWLPVFGRVFGRDTWKQTKTTVLTLNQILECQLMNCNIPAEGQKSVDLISIDTDGTELDVLRGLDAAKWAPRVIIAEAFAEQLHGGVVGWSKDNKYTVARKMGVNFILCRDEADAKVLAND